MPIDSPVPTPLAAIHGIGPKYSELLGKLGLLTHDDLLHFVPRRSEDRRHLKPVSEAEDGQSITVRGKVHSMKPGRWGACKLEITVGPATLKSSSDLVTARWFGFRPWGIK